MSEDYRRFLYIMLFLQTFTPFKLNTTALQGMALVTVIPAFVVTFAQNISVRYANMRG